MEDCMDTRELKNEVADWVDSQFDHVPLSVAEQLTDDMLFERIDLSDYDEDDDGEPPYPMWGTLFHYRGWGHDGFIEAAKKARFIVIKGVPEFDGVMLGVQGAGYSFYGAHWIPLYLALFEREDEFKGVSFRHL
jgi:hypothetical protein